MNHRESEEIDGPGEDGKRITGEDGVALTIAGTNQPLVSLRSHFLERFRVEQNEAWESLSDAVSLHQL
jgi:hypothetical protein